VVRRRRPTVQVGVDEFVSARDASRGFSALVQRLRSGELEKAVIVWRNQPRAVLLSIEEYARLLREGHDG